MSAEATDHWLSHRRFALALALIIAALFPTVLFGSETFFFRDYGLFGYPLAQYHRDAFWRGELPLWNPYNNCGLPFLAQWNTMVLYPGSAIYLLFPMPWSLGIFCLFHLWLAGAGMFALAKTYSHSRMAAAAAGLAFAFSGLLLSSIKYPNNMAALGWMPWVVWFVEAALTVETHPRRLMAISILVGAMQMLTGSPEIIALTWMFLGAQAIARMFNSRKLCLPWQTLAKIPARLTIIVIVVGCLAAVQLLPFLDLLAHSQRSAKFSGSEWPMPISGWLNFFVPLLHSFPSYHGVFAQFEQYWISSYYLPLGLLVFAPFSFLHRHGVMARSLAIISVVFLLLALGDSGILYQLAKHLPGFSIMRFPIKFVVPVVFCWALLGAMGLNVLVGTGLEVNKLAGLRRRLLLVSTVYVGLIALAVILAVRAPVPGEQGSVTLGSALSRGFVLAIALVLAWGLIARKWAVGRVTLALCGLIIVDGLTHAPNQNPLIPAVAYGPDLASSEHPRLGKGRSIVSASAEERLDHSQFDSPSREYLTSRTAMYSNCNLLDRVPKIDGFFSLYVRDEGTINQILYASTNYVFEGLMDFLGVTQISDDANPTQWLPRKSARPLIDSGAQTVFLNRERTLRTLANASFDPRKTVVLPEADSALLTHTNATARILVSEYKAERIAFSADAAAPAIITIAQSNFHGWRATIDGVEKPIHVANHAFQAIALPAGHHEVVLTYHEPKLLMGAVISGLAFIGTLLALRGPGKFLP